MQDSPNCTEEGRTLYATVKYVTPSTKDISDCQAAILKASALPEPKKREIISRIYWKQRPLDGD